MHAFALQSGVLLSIRSLLEATVRDPTFRMACGTIAVICSTRVEDAPEMGGVQRYPTE